MTRFILFLLLPFGLLAQTPDCTQKGALTTATTFTALPNNTGNPICSAFVLVWNSTGFTGVTIQLEGADTIAGSYTAFTAATPFANPTTALSGAIVIQATTKLAFVRVNVSSVTGTGAVNFQINGYRGVTPVAGGGGGGSGCGTLGGDLSGTCAAATVVGIEGHPVSGVQGNGALAQLSTGTPTPSDCVVFDANGNTTDSGSPTCGGLTAALISIFGNTGPNITALLVPTGDSLGPSGTGTITATQVPAAAGATASTNGQLKYDTTAQNLHAAQGSADSIAVLTKVTPGNGNCASWLNSGGTLNLSDAGAPCGSSSGGGGIITYSSSADTFLGTQFLPPGGGAPASSTESDVQVASPAAATVSNLHVEVSSALGVGVTAVFTWRDAGSSTTSTCSISGNSAKSCTDTTHSFNAAAGDLLDMQVVTTGTPAAVNVLFTSAFGTSGVGITTFTTTGTSGAATYNATTGAMNVPNYATGGGSTFPLAIVQEISFQNGASASTSYTFTLPYTAASSGNTLFMMIATDGGQAFTTPSGWTVDLNTPQTANSRFVLMHKASASDTTVAFTASGNSLWAGYFMEVSGSHSLDQSSIAGQAVTPNILFPTITPTVNSVVFALVAATNDTTITAFQAIFNNVINPAWKPLYAGNQVGHGGRYLFGYVSTVPASNVTTQPPPLIQYISMLGGSGLVVTTFSIL